MLVIMICDKMTSTVNASTISKNGWHPIYINCWTIDTLDKYLLSMYIIINMNLMVAFDRDSHENIEQIKYRKQKN